MFTETYEQPNPWIAEGIEPIIDFCVHIPVNIPWVNHTTHALYDCEGVPLTPCDREYERGWLSDFYESTNGHGWYAHMRRGWLSDMDYCDWHGVYCCVVENVTCMNALWFTDAANMTGTLPSAWLNSTTLTMIALPNDNRLTGISGSIPAWKEALPNLVAVQLGRNNLTGELPDWPMGNCMLWFSVANSQLSGPVPDWNKQRYIWQMLLEFNYFEGRLPCWNEWLMPASIRLEQEHGYGFTGTICDWSNWYGLWLTRIELSNSFLTGTVPPLPRLYLPKLSFLFLMLDNNSLSGDFPFYSVSSVLVINIAANQRLTGNVGEFNASLNPFLLVFNISNNRIHGRLPCMSAAKQLTVLEFSKNNIKGVTSSEECDWPTSLQILMGSKNAHFSGHFPDMFRGVTNLSVLSFGQTRVSGSVPSELLITTRGKYLELYECDLNDVLPSVTDVYYNQSSFFAQSLIIIGNSFRMPLPAYVSNLERGLVISIIPKHEILLYFWAPLLSAGMALSVYFALFLHDKVINSKLQSQVVLESGVQLWARKEDSDSDVSGQIIDKSEILFNDETEFRNLLKTILKILGFIFVPLSIAQCFCYYYGSDYNKNGYFSLKFSATYLGKAPGKGSKGWSWPWDELSLILYCVTTVVCTLTVVFLHRTQKIFEQTFFEEQSTTEEERDIRKTEKHSLAANSAAHFESVHSNDSLSFDSVLPTIEVETQKTERICSKALCVEMILCLLAVVVLSLPLCVYSVYHTVPDKNVVLLTHLPPSLVRYIFPIFITYEKQFIIPLVVSFIFDKTFNNIRRHFIQILRFLTLILFPLIVIFAFDNGCFQYWKHLWNFCRPPHSDRVDACIYMPQSSFDFNNV